jgi:dihydrodipicolinate synthase/N-acetylneuraminate lyase
MGQPHLGSEVTLTPIGGVNVACITPSGKEGRGAEIGALLELVDFLCAAGVQGIALLGSTGEFVHLESQDRVRLIYMAVKRSRVPVLAGVSHSSLSGALELAREAVSAGAAGLLLMPPYFFRYSQAEIREFYLQFVSQAGGSAKVYLYNIPFFTNPLECGTALQLLSTGCFAGIKDSSGQWEYFDQLKRLRESRSFGLLVGNDVIFTRARQAGADGVVSGVACAVPELLLGLDRAIQKCATGSIERLDARLQEFIGWLDRLPAPVGIKIATAARGLAVGPLAVPLSSETQKLLDEFREWFVPWLAEIKRETLE